MNKFFSLIAESLVASASFLGKASAVAKRVLSAIVIISFVLAGSAQTQEQQANCNCSEKDCKKISRAELFIKGFASSGNSKGLRTSQLEMEEQVKNAFWQIDSTRRQVEAGKLTKEFGNLVIDGFEKQIRNYIHDKASEAKVRAATGQASDIPAISKSLGGLLSVARQDAYLGREEVALQAQQRAVETLVTFSQEFAKTCQKQNFPVETALGLERQNQLWGTDISLEHCMNRKVSAELSSQGVQYHFETCNDLSPSPKKWKLKISGRVAGEGKGDEGFWDAKFLWKGIKTEMGGEMEIFSKEIEVEEESVKIPDDAGPNAKPNGCASAPTPKPPPQTKKVQVLKMRIAPLHLIGDRAISGNYTEGQVEAEVKREDIPCDPATYAQLVFDARER